jgi:hypothetical protein
MVPLLVSFSGLVLRNLARTTVSDSPWILRLRAQKKESQWLS